jgi:predicted RecA/RadA family phage recombinase
MKNYLREGTTIPTVAPSGGVVSGAPFLIGAIVGVAAVDADEGADLEAHIEGVFTLPKASADVIGQGDTLYFDAAAGEFTTDDDTGNNPKVAVAFRAAGGGATSIDVKLTPGVA